MTEALIAGTALAVAALVYVLYPLFADPPGASTRASSAGPPVGDEALEALIREHRARPTTCPSCGPRPEPDARYCSQCGGRVVDG